MPTVQLFEPSGKAGISVVMSELSDLIDAAAGDMPVRAIADRAKELGHTISPDTVWKYRTGQHPAKVNDDYLKAFADVFPKLRLAQLRRAALIPPDLGEWDPPREVHSLNKPEREALELIIKSMAVGKAARRLIVVPEVHDPEDFDAKAALNEAQDAGPSPEDMS